MVAFLYASHCSDLNDSVEVFPIIRSPVVYLSRPPMIFSIVLLPQPDAPIIDTNSDSRKASVTPLNARTV